MTLVYYLLDASRHGQRVKIGITTNLPLRLMQIKTQTMSRQQPIVLALERGGIEVERERHARFAACRLSGEWFTYDCAAAPDVVDPRWRVQQEAIRDLYVWISELENPVGFLMDREDLWPDAAGWAGVPFTTKAGIQDDPPALVNVPEPQLAVDPYDGQRVPIPGVDF